MHVSFILAFGLTIESLLSIMSKMDPLLLSQRAMCRQVI